VGETQNQPFQLSFNPSLKVDFQGSRVTSEGGLLLVRELDERLGLNQLIEEHLTADRRGKNTQLRLPDLLRQSIYNRLAGYEERCRAAVARSDLPVDRLGEDPGAECRSAFAAALVRDRGAEPRREPGRSEPHQSRTAGEGGSHECAATGGAGFGQHGNPGLWRTRALCAQRTLRVHLLSPLVAVQWGRRLPGCEAATEQHPLRKSGRKCCPRSSASSNWGRKWCFAAMLRLPHRTSRSTR